MGLRLSELGLSAKDRVCMAALDWMLIRCGKLSDTAMRSSFMHTLAGLTASKAHLRHLEVDILKAMGLVEQY